MFIITNIYYIGRYRCVGSPKCKNVQKWFALKSLGTSGIKYSVAIDVNLLRMKPNK